MKHRRPWTSEFSEHTLEFSLVPAFRKALSVRFRSTLAFYFWASREGSRISLLTNAPGPVRAIAVYPRRPKRTRDDPHRVVKINAELFGAAEDYLRCGIPVFVGIPQINSIFSLAEDVQFAWYGLLGNRHEDDVELEVDVAAQSCLPRSVIGPLLDDEVCRQTLLRSRPMVWSEVVDAINGVRQAHRPVEWRMMTQPYKPVFFLAW